MKKITFLKSLFVASMALMLALSPALVSADNDKAKKNNSCMRVYTSILFPWWVKVDADANITGRCWFPFGVGKKFRSENPKPLDVTAPVISKIEVDADYNDVVIKWETDERADATVFWGTTAGLNVQNSGTLQVSNGNLMKEHRIKIPGLVANTKYYAVIRSKDASGNTAFSAELNFNTKAPVVAGDRTAPVISSVVAVSALNSVSVGWITNEPATTKVIYGKTTPLSASGSGALSLEVNDLKVNHLIVVPNLSLNTQYYMMIESKDAAGNVQTTTEFTAMTGI